MEMEQRQEYHPAQRRPSKFKEFFGQFADPAFYVEMAKSVIVEVIKAMTLALTGTVAYQIQKKFAGGIIQQNVTGGDNRGSLTEKAFGPGNNYSNQYNNNSSYYPTTSQQPGTTFPGFGTR